MIGGFPLNPSEAAALKIPNAVSGRSYNTSYGLGHPMGWGLLAHEQNKRQGLKVVAKCSVDGHGFEILKIDTCCALW